MTATALLLGLVALVLLAANVAYIGALYWVHVMRPAPMQRAPRTRPVAASYTTSSQPLAS